jgi:hypothetical protein
VGVLSWIEAQVARRRERRAWHLFAANLRIFLGFALLPAGLKKVLGEPFTDPSNVGPFHELLHAFYATGALYPFVGATQVVIALLLMSQRFAFIGALMMLPIVTAILVLCWSTAVYPTASVVTAMWLGTVFLVGWEIERWRPVFEAGQRLDGARWGPRVAAGERVAARTWERAGLAIFGVYLALVALSGEVYRPRGLELHEPMFWALPALLVFVVGAFVVDVRWWRRRAR